jgi:hypothetical protein
MEGNTLHSHKLTQKKVSKKHVFIYKSVIIFVIMTNEPLKVKITKTPLELLSYFYFYFEKELVVFI